MKAKSLTVVGFVMLLALLFSSCGEKRTTGVVVGITSEVDTVEKFDPFVEGNKNIIRKENEDIQLFIKRYGWNMHETGSGLYIEILEEGSGACFVDGDEVTLDYQMQLLDGEKIYDSKTEGVKRFEVGKKEEMAGLHEAVKLLRRGGKARLVLPSYLAYGVAGDGRKIRGRKSVAMTIQVIN